ncbi:MAG: hypothetical protein WA172_17265 [Terriglobales bacterium]
MKTTNSEVTVIRRLCKIAGQLGVPIVTPLRCPDSGTRNWKNVAGMFVSTGGHMPRDMRATLNMLHVQPPVIILRYQTADVLAHELSHAVSMFDTMLDSRMGRRVSPLLRRLCEQHGIIYYGETEIVRLAEMRARCLEHRLMGKPLPPTLMRLTARAWSVLERSTQ